jgi:hypothetical protein
LTCVPGWFTIVVTRGRWFEKALAIRETGGGRVVLAFEGAKKGAAFLFGHFQARQEALEAYKKDYADILSIFEGDKRVTDSFFKQPPRGKKGKQPPETKA